MAASPAQAASAAQASAQDSFQVRFAELLSSGMPPTRPRRRPSSTCSSREESFGPGSDGDAGPETTTATAAAAAPMAVDDAYHVALEPSPPSGTSSGAAWAAELAELSAMGFSDVGRNVQLLERYNGRLVRVVNARWLAGTEF